MPLRDDLVAMDGAISAVERATIAHYQGKSTHGGFAYDVRADGHPDGFRVSLAAGEGMHCGIRVFGDPPNARFYVLLDAQTRHLLAVMDYGVLNSMRVGAIAGLAARELAPDARVMGMLGSGWQARPQVAAMRRALPALELVKVFSPTREHRERFARETTEWADLRVEAVDSAEAAVSDADVVDLMAPGHFDVREPLLQPGSVKPGALVISTASNQTTEKFVRGSRVVVATWEGLAEDQSPRHPYTRLIPAGQFTRDDVTELGPILLDGADPRRSPNDVVLYEMANIYVHDLFVATWGYEWARDRGLGYEFDLNS